MDPDVEMSPDERQARDDAKHLRALLASPGWAIIKGIALRQIQTRIDNYVLQPRTDMKSEWEKEYMKGEVAGMRTLLAIVETALENKEIDSDNAARDAASFDPDSDDTD